MSKKILCIYHKNCNDGFTAAWAMLLKFGYDKVEFAPMNYGEIMPRGIIRMELDDDWKGYEEVYFLDFSPTVEQLQLLKSLKDIKKIHIIDHHKTVDQVLGDELKGVEFVYDVNKSGAMLAWEYFHPNQEAPPIVRYVQDRDLWLHKLPKTKEINLLLTATPKTFENWSEVHQLGLENMIDQGSAIAKYTETMIDSAIKYAHHIKINDEIILAVNVPKHMASDISERMLKHDANYNFVCTYFYEDYDKVAISLRSRKGTDIDVGEIARLNGGGGHMHASGFIITPEELNEIVLSGEYEYGG